MKIKSTLATSLLLGALSLTTLPLQATNPPGGGTCPGGGGCDDSSPSQSGNSTTTTDGFKWTFNVGLAHYPDANSFLANARVGAGEGATQGTVPRSLDSILSFYSGGGLQKRHQLKLELNSSEISAFLADPANITYNHATDAKVIELNGFINQVLTDTALTHIEKLANGDGFNLRIWSKDSFVLGNKVNGLYPVPSNDPISEITFKNPDHPADNNCIDLTTKERFGSTYLAHHYETFQRSV